ncbi:hypothetical protein HMI54_009017 [Coelomomyces lativittatus]|nr:hypothetical protein HMI56_004536 [Coelomomyces lativittatus]KAJ1518398.1 hypothetical protein HMI55_004703 [Coelomomyces lativittatus]KAJ1518737.1 hypothetical protein HMI54_009017 [Coelomomyces lativittatus]
MELNPAFHYSSAVKSAILNNKPVVALESAIITHGMPYPENLETVNEIERIIREEQAEPATIAILEGRIHIGLEPFELNFLANLPVQKVNKTSRRDISPVIATRGNGGTTVSGTLCLAHKAGLNIFVTGGIGGVHRGVETSMDISADLIELSKTPMAVVCAGVKSILDIPRTLEYLETHGVTVLTLGNSNDFPAFFVPSSGSFSPYSTKNVGLCATILAENLKLGLGSGILIACPIPDSEANDASEIENYIQQALEEANDKKISGHAVTPFMLSRVSQLSQGKSLKANSALIKNNAREGAKIAVALCRLMRGELA